MRPTYFHPNVPPPFLFPSTDCKNRSYHSPSPINRYFTEQKLYTPNHKESWAILIFGGITSPSHAFEVAFYFRTWYLNNFDLRYPARGSPPSLLSTAPPKRGTYCADRPVRPSPLPRPATWRGGG